jgi:stage IV sporulation protein FB
MNSTAGWQFRVLNFPVKVQFSFFLIALLLGFSLGNVILLALWVVIVFVSVLLHELGHAIAAEYYGRAPHIELYSMGGLTISTRYSLLSYPKEILISFAGPLAGFLLGGLIFGLVQVISPISNTYVNFILRQLIWVNIGWGILNLIPILPLDGGHIMRNLFHWLKNPYDERTPLMISIVFGVLGVIAAIVLLRSIYLALLVGWLTFNNYRALR